MMRKAKADDSTKGILQADAGKAMYKLTRYEPAEELRPYIQHYWLSEWNVPGPEPYPQTVLSHPNVNLVFEPENVRVYGIWEKTSTQWLHGRGSAFAAKFTPAGFYSFWKQPVSGLTGRSTLFSEAFGDGVQSTEKEILGEDDVSRKADALDSFFLARLPDRDENVGFLNGIVSDLAADREILQVQQLADRCGKSERMLQRLFERYIGVSPKGVIRRFRMHEVAEKMDKGEVRDWTELSFEMGYYDQAHFIKDFKSVLGTSPEDYMRAVSLKRPGNPGD